MKNFTVQTWEFSDSDGKIKKLTIDYKNKTTSIDGLTIPYEDGLATLGWILKSEVEQDKEKIKELDF